jgi:hypothetical protein
LDQHGNGGHHCVGGRWRVGDRLWPLARQSRKCGRDQQIPAAIRAGEFTRGNFDKTGGGASDERKKEKDIADAGIRQRDEQLALAHEAEAAAIAKVKAADDRIALLEKSIPSVVDNTQIRITVNRKSDEPLDYKNIWGRVDESIQQTNPLIPAKLKPDHFFAYAKASGFCDKNFDPEKLLPTFSVTDGTAENQLISSTKYQFAERVLAWRLLDPEYRLFVSSDDTEEVVKKLKQTMLESTIQTLEYAKNRKLFAGLPYEIDPEVELPKLKSRWMILIRDLKKQ